MNMPCLHFALTQKINYRKEITIMKNQNQKTSSGVALTQAQWERCDRLANENGCRSRNAFIRDAIDFYCSWLEKEQTERFLTPALESVISAKIRDSEERISRNLFKLFLDKLVANCLCFFACIINKEFGKRHKCIRVATVENLTIFAKAHKSVACSAFSVASGTE